MRTTVAACVLAALLAGCGGQQPEVTQAAPVQRAPDRGATLRAWCNYEADAGSGLDRYRPYVEDLNAIDGPWQPYTREMLDLLDTPDTTSFEEVLSLSAVIDAAIADECRKLLLDGM